MAFIKMAKCQFYLETTAGNVKHHHNCLVSIWTGTFLCLSDVPCLHDASRVVLVQKCENKHKILGMFF